MQVQDKSKRASKPGLNNFMEELTETVLKNMLLEYKRTAFSDSAIQDIKALALNRLWPMYTTSNSGRDFLQKVVAEDKIEKDVMRELRVAIDIVRSNPRE